jgi:hypothetical protein
MDLTMSALHLGSGHPGWPSGRLLCVESRCGAVALGRTQLLHSEAIANPEAKQEEQDRTEHCLNPGYNDHPIRVGQRYLDKLQ